MMISYKNLRKIAEIMRNFLEIFLKICPKKMYSLIRYAGNSWSVNKVRSPETTASRDNYFPRGMPPGWKPGDGPPVLVMQPTGWAIC